MTATSTTTATHGRAVIGTVSAQQALTFRRQRVRLIGVATLLMVTAMAGILGWSSHHTIVRVFDQAVQMQAAARGNAAPANPFLLKPSLSLLSNMVVYIPLIGALIAVMVGHLAMAEDQTDGIGRLIFTRPIAAPSTPWARSSVRSGYWPLPSQDAGYSAWSRC